MTPVDVLLSAIAGDPGDETAWLALADCLEEQGEADRAELVRLREWLRHAPPQRRAERRRRETRLQELLASGVAPAVPRRKIALSKKVSLELVLIPASRFLMGSPKSEPQRSLDEGPQHVVTLTRPFWLGVYPVTQAQWQAIMHDNPSRARGANRPVESVSWDECQLFCAKLSEHSGLRFRLPSEAEWEYACRAGTTTTYHTGDGVEAMNRAGWCDAGSDARETCPVGRYLPNAWGLYDMHGNVREWCSDCLRAYTSEAVVDPHGGGDSDSRVVRGGSWTYDQEDSRAASRYERPITYHLDYYGCRVLLEHG
jgi:uncharacterized protein (TIGR02996 family)